jgi:Phosphodiester glycosidase
MRQPLLNSLSTLYLLLGYTTGAAFALQPALQVQHHAHPQASLMTITVPKAMAVSVAQAPRLQTVPQFADPLTLAVINAGFFDPMTTLNTSWVSSQFKVVGDPTQNPSLMENPKLQPYLPIILNNRPELRAYQCAGHTTPHYAIVPHLAPAACPISWAVGAGPQLLPVYNPQTEAFTDTDPITGRRTRDPLGVDMPNARSAVALLPDNRLMLVYVGQTPDGKKGLTLPQLAQWLKQQGVSQAMALDGGSSTSVWLQGKTYWGKGSWQNGNWQVIRRPVKTALVVKALAADSALSNVNKCK